MKVGWPTRAQFPVEYGLKTDVGLSLRLKMLFFKIKERWSAIYIYAQPHAPLNLTLPTVISRGKVLRNDSSCFQVPNPNTSSLACKSVSLQSLNSTSKGFLYGKLCKRILSECAFLERLSLIHARNKGTIGGILQSSGCPLGKHGSRGMIFLIGFFYFFFLFTQSTSCKYMVFLLL